MRRLSRLTKFTRPSFDSLQPSLPASLPASLPSVRSDLKKDETSDSESSFGDLLHDVHNRQIDPADPDVYIDAFLGPLYHKYARVQKENDVFARFADYRMLCLFLILNVALQLSIAWKIHEITETSYASVGHTVFDKACWRIPAHTNYVGTLYPSSLTAVVDPSSLGFDCLQPVLTLSMFPNELDLNHDGVWSLREAHEKSQRMTALGSDMSGGMGHVLGRMARYDQEHRQGSKSNATGLDMAFFTHFRSNLKMCLPVDPALCGNMEAKGQLRPLLPELSTSEDRVVACRENFDSFCSTVFGGEYRWIYMKTTQICGEPEYDRESGVNVVSYERAENYKGLPDSIVGTTFSTFLMLLLFVWAMLMLLEFRSSYNMLYVIIRMPSTSDDDPSFASVEDDKMVVKQLPRMHKYFSILCIGIPRLVIALVLSWVGTSFLAATTDLQDLVLNSTALNFLLEVDNIIHASLLGDGFERHVLDQCAPVTVESEVRGTWEPYGFALLAMLATAAYTAYAYYNERGLLALSDGLNCLCQFEGSCWAAMLMQDHF